MNKVKAAQLVNSYNSNRINTNFRNNHNDSKRKTNLFMWLATEDDR